MDNSEEVAAYIAAIMNVKSVFLLSFLLDLLSDEYARYVADIINNKSLPLFGALLRLVCSQAGISQGKLGKDSKMHMEEFKKKGWMRTWETVDISQSAISDASRGKLEPSFRQLRIWLYAIRRIYEDPSFERKCLERGKEKPNFPEELEKDMWYLALKGTEDEIVAAYERRRNLIIHLPRREWWNGIEPKYDPIEAEPDTETRLPLPPQQNRPSDSSPLQSASFAQQYYF